ncbi:hypothetical protein CTAM01_17123 [Colletotrichum tamarilloi]|uniref:Zn(2)-C6 fungal-type domain-containing protein n=1 Tax=Colletotrichum tamarilloi TaxID=1209934 RepID=A0ABQ9QGJ6_9PEZI|nr:uncharacterized protein CTAM01_17123 [Colletotrichum tamarilloi]KAK1460584.1 hypothetical protein CTAM01_17123 [Colletotrichum tamarilloi]
MSTQHRIPDRIEGIQLPTAPVHQPTVYPNDLTSHKMTSYLLTNSLSSLSKTFHKICDLGIMQPQRWIKLNPKITKNGRCVPGEIAVTRTQAADAIWTTVYGDAKTSAESCARCKAGKGMFADCVAFTGRGCSSCNYTSGAHECTLIAPPVTTPRNTPTKVVKRGRNHKGRGKVRIGALLESLGNIPAEHLRTMADALEQVAEQAEDDEEDSE